ncbi:MAG: hypothetical protein JW928_01040, partial [Candidatus Aureabacteria bacterium]|nr:hypothetical protein [Candidatus Auribacterota bacterium]
YPATRVNDGGYGNYWLSEQNNYSNHFIFSFPDEQQETVNNLKLVNYGNNNRSVKYFQILTSSNAAAKNNADHASWALASGSTETDEANIISSRIGGTLEDYGSQHGSYPASRVNDGGYGNYWLSQQNNYDNYFIFSFPDNESLSFDRMLLTNYGNNNRAVRVLRLFYSDDDDARADPDHGSWQSVTGTGDATKANIINKAFGGVLHKSKNQHGSYSASRVNDGGYGNYWLSQNGTTDGYFIFYFDGEAPKTFNRFVLVNYGNNARAVKNFELYYTDDPDAKDQYDHAGWVQINPDAGVSFTGEQNTDEVEYAFDGDYTGTYFMMKILDNYGDASYVGLTEMKLISADETFDVFGAITGEKSGSSVEYAFDNVVNQKYFMVKVAENYTDSYTGLCEIQLFGGKTYADYGCFRAEKDSSVQSFDFDDVSAKYLQFRVIENYTDSYTGLVEIEAYGTKTLADFGSFTALKNSSLQEFTFSDTAARYFMVKVINNYGDSYTGAVEFRLLGSKTTGEFGVFSAEKISGRQTFSFADVGARYLQFRILENYGDSYTGLVELEAYGDATLSDFGIFEAQKSGALQEFSFDPVSAKYILFRILENYGDSYTGLSEIEVYGDTTYADFGVYAALKDTSLQEYELNESEGKYFMMKVLDNYGDSYTGLREMELISVFGLTLQDRDTGSTVITNDSQTNGKTIKITFSKLDPDATWAILSEDPGFAGASWFAISPVGGVIESSWLLSAGDGTKTLYAKVKNDAGDEESKHETIVLDTIPPEKVVNFTATGGVSTVTLSWQNPPDADFDRTEIRWSTSGFPATPSEGFLLGTFYGGPDETQSYDHVNLQNNTTYYYTIWAFDGAENYSEPVTASAVPLSPTERFEVTPDRFFQVAGTAFPVTIRALREDDTVNEDYQGTVGLFVQYGTPSSGTKDIVYNNFIFVDGVARVNVRYDDAGTIKIYAEEKVGTLNGLSEDIKLRPSHFDVAVSAKREVAGRDFSMTVTAKNSRGENTPNYSGSADIDAQVISPAGGKGEMNPAAVSRFVGGAATVRNMTFSEAGTVKFTVTDISYITGEVITGESSRIFFTPAGFKISLSAIPDNRNFFYTNETFSMTVQAFSYTNEKTENYRGQIMFQVPEGFLFGEDGASGAYTFTGNDAGVKRFEGVMGTQDETGAVTVVDADYDDITGQSDTIGFKTGWIVIEDNEGEIGDLEVRVKIVDKDDQIITSDSSTTFSLTLKEEKDNNTATFQSESRDVEVASGRAVLILNDTEDEIVEVIPESSPVLEPVSGSITFLRSFIGKQGIRIRMWKEIRD